MSPLGSMLCGRITATVLAGLMMLGVSLRADKDGQELEAESGVTEKEYMIPVLEYSFDRDLKHAAPLDYRSAKASGLRLAMRHRIDAIWSGASLFGYLDSTASDFPFVAEVQYQLRRSPWSDPERMARARLLDGARFQALVTREFGMGRSYEMSAAVQHAESILSNGNLDFLEQTHIPVEIRTDLAENTDFLVGVEFKSSKLTSNSELRQSSEQAFKAGVSAGLGEGFYAQVTAGARNSQLDGDRSESALEVDGALVWQAGIDSQYTLTFNRSTRPSLVADAFAQAETLSFAGDFTLSDMWSSYYGVSKSWAELEPDFAKEIYSGEIAVSFSPNQSIRFAGGYVFRSGSLNFVNEDEAEQIIRLSASVRY